MRRLLLLSLLASPPLALADGASLKCGPHQHVVEERDEEEGSKVSRCVCDQGWEAEGPGRPCQKTKPSQKSDKK